MGDFWHLAGLALIWVGLAFFAYGGIKFGRPTVINNHYHCENCKCTCHDDEEEDDE